jgi:hypothetical protein
LKDRAAATLVARNANDTTAAPVVVWQSLRLAEDWSVESGGKFSVGAFGRTLPSVAVKMFSHRINLQRNAINYVLLTLFTKIVLQ